MECPNSNQSDQLDQPVPALIGFVYSRTSYSGSLINKSLINKVLAITHLLFDDIP